MVNNYMKKIVFHVHSLEKGGAERVVANLSKQFSENGYRVSIATEIKGKDEYEIPPAVERVVVGPTQEQTQKGRASVILSRITNLRKYLKQTKPDIVIAFARKANYRALMAAMGTKIPVIACVRINPVGYYDFFSDKLQIPLLFRHASGFVFQTPDQRDFFPEYVRKKSKIILNPLNPKFIGNSAPTQREKAVVHSGRLVDFKNQLLLIESFEQVHQKHPDYILKIFGPDGHDGTKEKLEKLIDKYGANDYVKLMGPSNQLEKDMINGAVAAFSSDYEGMPNAMLEAMALGLPTVATDCPPGGPAMVIEHEKNGLLVPVGDVKALAEAISRLIENPEFAQRLGKNAARISELANADRIFKEWESYVLEIIRG